MATFTCNECGNQQSGFPGMPPASCNRCKKRGKIWTEDSASKPAAGGSAGGNMPSPPAPKAPQLPIGGMPTPMPPTITAPKIPASPAITPPKVPTPPVSNQPKMPTSAPISTTSNPVVTSQPIAPPISQPTPVPQPTPVVEAPTEVPTLIAAPLAKKPQAGRLIWELELPGNEEKLPQRTCPAIDQTGRIYLSFGRKLHAYDLNDSEMNLAWEFPMGGRVVSSPVVGSDGVIRVHAEEGKLYSLNKDGTSVHAPADTGKPLGWSTPLVDSHLNVWVSHCHGGLWRVAPGSDTAAPFLKSRHKLDCSGVIVGHTLYIGSENACVFAIDLAKERGSNQWDAVNNQGRAAWYINSALAIGQGPAVIATSRRNEIIAFRQDGSPNWNTQLDGLILGSPVVGEEGEIYLGICLDDGHSSNHGEFLRIDGSSGRIRWRFRTSAPIESTAVLGDDGSIYFGDNEGTIYCLNKEGREQWKDDIGQGIRSPGALLPGGILVFGAENGSFFGLKTESSGLAQGLWPKFLGDPKNTSLINL